MREETSTRIISILKAFSALRRLFPSPYWLITQVRRASSRFHIAEVEKLRTTEREGSLPQVMHSSNWPESWCRHTCFLIPIQRLLPIHFTATPHLIARALCSEPSHLCPEPRLLCPTQKITTLSYPLWPEAMRTSVTLEERGRQFSQQNPDVHWGSCVEAHRLP